MFRKFWYHLGRLLSILLARSILELSIQWKSPFPKKPFILAANHPSTIDPIVVTTLLQERISVLIHGKLFKIPLVGRSLRFCGHIPVVYGSGQTALDEAQEHLTSGHSVAIFPEGEISPEGGFNEPHSGIARLALCSGAPVVPIGIYLDQKQLRRKVTHVDGETMEAAWYAHGPYAMTIGNSLLFTGDVDDRALVRHVSQQVMRLIINLSRESAQRVRAYNRMTWRMAFFWWLQFPMRLIRSLHAFSIQKV
jgi:1-acyl-sn-glycerol-3-phosphate acyltransferase